MNWSDVALLAEKYRLMRTGWDALQRRRFAFGRVIILLFVSFLPACRRCHCRSALVNAPSKKFIQEDGDVDGKPFALELGQIAELLIGLECAQGLTPPVFHDDAWR